MLFTIIGSILTCLVAIFGAIQQYKEKVESKNEADASKREAKDAREEARESAKELQTAQHEFDQKLSAAKDALISNQDQLISRTADLADSQNELHQLSRAIKFALPKSISVNYRILFSLDGNRQKEADSILKKLILEKGNYYAFDPRVISHLLDWQQGNEHVNVAFLKNYIPGQPTDHILSFENHVPASPESYRRFHLDFYYNPSIKGFSVDVSEIHLKRVDFFETLSDAMKLTSKEDLNGSTMVVHQMFPPHFKNVHIEHFNIVSDELPLNFWELENVEGRNTFIAKTGSIK